MAAGRPWSRQQRFLSGSFLVVSGLIFLAGIVIPPGTDRSTRPVDRDEQRIQDLQTVARAVRAYARMNGEFPPPDPEEGSAGWDTTKDGAFLGELVEAGLLPGPFVDPVNDSRHHYRYFCYPGGYDGRSRPFFVLGIRHFESEEFQRREFPGFASAGRDWGDEFDYVIAAEMR